jgi:hypothetical protein
MSLLSMARRSAVLIAVVASPLAAQPAPTASEIVSRYVKAIGGTEAIQKITSVKQTGTLSMPAMGLGGETEVLFTLPNKNATRINIGGLGEMLVGTDGDVAWSVNPMQGPRLLEDKELAATKESADFAGQMLMPADRFTSIDVVGTTDFGGEKTYQLKFVSKATGIVTQRYFSVATGLLRGAEATTDTPMGSVTSVSTFSDYKAFGGVMFPTKTETAVGPQAMVMTTTNVEFNTVPASAIAVPESVKPMIRK